MFRKLVYAVALIAVAAAGVFWWVTRPELLDESVVAALEPGDAGQGERIFWAGGCASCHARPDAEGEAKLELAGGVALETPFGKFVAPNISPDPDRGIGGWDVEDFVNAMMRGVSPEGEHYYPAFPYSSYARMDPQDVADLFAFLQTLPPVAERTGAHELEFPFTVRRGVGLWKQLYLRTDPVIALDEDASDQVLRGRHLVEGPGHCGECHTPRLFSGGPQLDRWLAGAPAAEGDGTVPNITPSEDGLGSWTKSDIAYYLESGFTPEFDSVGGAMVDVQENMAQLPAEDREAIAAYLKAVPPME